MTKEEILDKVKKGSYSQQQLIAWIGGLPNPAPKVKPIDFQVGDVFFHSVFKHPYVLLQKKKELYICGLLTTEESFPDILEICQSRFFSGSYFTKTLFTATKMQGSFIGVYSNNKHLREVRIKLKEILK